MTGAPLILLTAGGTGGHVFPAEALAAELMRRGHRLGLVTDKRGTHYSGALEAIDRYQVSGGGIAGKSLIDRLRSIFALGGGYWQARRLLRRLRPAAVVGFGGYASIPAVMAASHFGVPSAIHEQNAVLGRANRLLAPRVSKIASSYPSTERILSRWRDKVMLTGMPVRPTIEAVRAAAYPPLDTQQDFSLLILGGSQGAQIFSDLVPAAIQILPPHLRQRLHIAQQCRPEDLERVRSFYQDHGIEADLQRFFEDVPSRLKAAHLVIARSGSSTMAELAAVGRPAILVPYPHAIDDHQTANARAFADQGGGWLMPQAECTPDSLAAQLRLLMNAPEKLTRAAERAAAAGLPDAAARLADLVLGLAEDPA
jgi:UDP-N-acetylglucosamine--N-acetylmuramyl-(pentapeptide) pyrophosphoryl-undecaprenol N-acetylglucosamine transferase